MMIDADTINGMTWIISRTVWQRKSVNTPSFENLGAQFRYRDPRIAKLSRTDIDRLQRQVNEAVENDDDIAVIKMSYPSNRRSGEYYLDIDVRYARRP